MAYPFRPNIDKEMKRGRETDKIDRELFSDDESTSCDKAGNNPTRKRSHLEVKKQVRIESCC